MPMPTTPDTWSRSLDLPSRLFGQAFGESGYELYEEDDRFVLTIDMPGFERSDIDLTWYEGRLDVAAEHVDEERNRKQTFHRTFRLPKDVEVEDVSAEYHNGVLEVELPIAAETTRGIDIEVQ
ncbi:Hsp20/alpha crystallin family protein [Haloplanus sp. GCM10025708]|uniref:Hsp20/alpha crystallin family protein n=1 Tax=Haloferacaceae TaxID=1644056 RepID=UPI003606B683